MEHITIISAQVEKSAMVTTLRGVYKATKQLSGKQIRSTDVIDDENGIYLTSTTEQQAIRWRGFFKSTFHQAATF